MVACLLFLFYDYTFLTFRHFGRAPALGGPDPTISALCTSYLSGRLESSPRNHG